MSSFLNSSMAPHVSMDLSNSWAARSLKEALAFAKKDARFQQKQMQEKEEKLLRLYENQQQRAFEKVSRGSSGNSSVSGGTSPVGTVGATPGRVRQMFDERRQKAGIDRSYPLEPLKQTTRLNGHAPATRVSSLDRSNTITKGPTRQTNVKTTVQRTVSHSYGNKPLKTRSVRQTSQATYANGQLIEENKTFEERNANDEPVYTLRHKQRELEELMNNHNINDNLEDEELPDVGIDEVDEMRITSPQPNENENYINRRSLSNGNYAVSSTGSTPTKKLANAKASPTNSSVAKDIQNVRKEVSKTTTPNKTSSTRSTPNEKKNTMKSAASPKSMPATPKPGTSTGKTPRTRAPVHSTVARDDLVPCKFCQRRFATDRLGTHEDICAKTLKKKRKIYDAVKHRVQGTEAETFVKKGPKAVPVKAKKPDLPKPNWRHQHEEFIATIRAAKMAQAHVAAGGKLTDLPPPPPSTNPDYVQCPHCGRRFNEAAASRHIPKCATMLHNKPNRLGAQPKKKY